MNIINLGYRSTHYYALEIKDGFLLVDCGWPGMMGEFASVAKRKGVDLGEIKFILVTHYHMDHAGLAQAVGQVPQFRPALASHRVGLELPVHPAIPAHGGCQLLGPLGLGIAERQHTLQTECEMRHQSRPPVDATAPSWLLSVDRAISRSRVSSKSAVSLVSWRRKLIICGTMVRAASISGLLPSR